MATRTISTKLAIEGEQQYRDALKNINSGLGTLKSELKLVESSFEGQQNSYEALSAKGEVLGRMYAEQENKVSKLKEVLEEAKKAQTTYTERVSEAEEKIFKCRLALEELAYENRDTSEEQARLTKELEGYNKELDEAKSYQEAAARGVNSWQSELNKSQTELNKLNSDIDKNSQYLDEAKNSSDGCATSIDEFGKEVKEAGNDSEEAGSKFGKLGDIVKGVGAAMAAATAAAAAAAVKLGKEVITAYADYEQLVGGVETLFKDSADVVKDYAANAYKTAGLSANEYMETVTGFSASLISSLGGDTAKAAEYADMAITDMSDNANKMGSDIESLQNAYAGFAKQQYNMLDNLKLGYGGTKSEMERLLADAQAISGIEYNIDSYADVIAAIHVIQESMDITGTTAKEAEHTISGSIAALQSAIQNLVAGLGDADADIEMLCGNVAEAFTNVLNNITPIVENLIAALPTAMDALLSAAGELLPMILEAVTGLISQVLETMLTMLPELIPAVVETLMTLVDTIIENLPLFVEAAMQIVTSLVSGIGQALPELIPAAVEAVTELVKALIDNIPLLVDAALELVEGLADGVIEAIPVLLEALPELITSLIDKLLESIPKIIETGVTLLTALVDNLPLIIETIIDVLPEIIDSVITTLLDHLPEIIDAGIELLTALIEDLPTIILTIVEALPEIITSIVSTLLDHLPELIEAGVTLLTALITNLPQIIFELARAMPQIITGMVEALANGVPQFIEIGGNLVRGLWDGIQQLSGWLWDNVSGWITGIWDGVKDFFGIESPSKKFAELGGYMAKGLGVGFGAEMKTVGEEMQNAIPTVSLIADAEAEMSRVKGKLAAGLGEIGTEISATATVSEVYKSLPSSSSVSAGGSAVINNNFNISELVVREEADVKRIAKELYQMGKSKSRGRGVVTA